MKKVFVFCCLLGGGKLFGSYLMGVLEVCYEVSLRAIDSAVKYPD